MKHLQKEFIAQLETNYPALKNQPLNDLVSENLISPFTIELPQSILQQAKDIVAAAFAMREKPAYLEHYAPLLERYRIPDPGNKSIAMSYDFHVDQTGDLKLIEINTNASFLLLGYEMYRTRKIDLPVSDFSTQEIQEMILQELRLQNKNVLSPRIVTIDEKPESQRLYVEFLAYHELFKNFGWDSQILDYRNAFKNNPDFIYNRHTDFLLSHEGGQDLLRHFQDRSVCLSPNPFEYLLLADKQRLIDWGRDGFFSEMGLPERQMAVLKKMLPDSKDLNAETQEFLWGARKKYFFKPKRAFGSKQSFRGASISRKYFEDLLGEEIIAQEYIPPAEKTFQGPEGALTFKYDLRCYAYRGRLQLVLARLYQGQVTNLRTPLGGFGCVKFSS